MPDLELSDDDILDAMQHIPGYIDITTSDFRAIYHLAHAHALERLFSSIRASRLMRAGVDPLRPEMPLDQAAESLARQGVKSLPVVDVEGRVIGMLTETDFLRRLRADSFLALLLRLLQDSGRFRHRCHETPVREAMTAPVVTVSEDATFRAIVDAFSRHEGRTMPVVDTNGALRGMLRRKDFLAACRTDSLS
jgi:CBS-domain-containing membrane protein